MGVKGGNAVTASGETVKCLILVERLSSSNLESGFGRLSKMAAQSFCGTRALSLE